MIRRSRPAQGGFRVTAIDTHTDPVTVQRPRVGLLPTTVTGILGIVPAGNQTDGGYLKFRNDDGVAEIDIGVRAFKCVGASPPRAAGTQEVERYDLVGAVSIHIGAPE